MPPLNLNLGSGNLWSLVIGDFDGDKLPDLLVPHAQGVKLFRNLGNGSFSDVTAQAGELANFNAPAAAVSFANFHSAGLPGILIGCLKGPNRYYKSTGPGTFSDATETLGLQQKVFNTRGICVADFNNDGAGDVLFNNEGQASVALLGNVERLVTLDKAKGK